MAAKVKKEKREKIPALPKKQMKELFGDASEVDTEPEVTAIPGDEDDGDAGAERAAIAAQRKKEREAREALLPPHVRRLRAAIRHAYNLQHVRIMTGNQAHDANESAYAGKEEKDFFWKQAAIFKALENEAVGVVEGILEKDFPIYTGWLKTQGGIGPVIGGVILGWFDIKKADTPSKMWAYAGLSVVNGHAPRRERGVSAHFNPWLRGKLVEVAAGNILKAAGASRAKAARRLKKTGEVLEIEQSPWEKCFEDYKHRKECQQVDVCAGCSGRGTYAKTKGKCQNCGGTGGPAPWGMSKKHRNSAAKRYMMKQFLAGLYVAWRTQEGLPVRPPYHEEKLHMAPHSWQQPAA